MKAGLVLSDRLTAVSPSYSREILTPQFGAGLDGNDPAMRYLAGFTLAALGKMTEAESQLREAVKLDPYYALPHVILGEILESHSKIREALDEYKEYLRLASLADLRRPDIQERVAMMTALLSAK